MVSIAILIAFYSLVGCYQIDKNVRDKGIRMDEKTIEQVQEKHTSQWMAIDGVEGTAIGLYKDKPCIKIFSSKKAQDLWGVIPSTVGGYPVIIEETGTFRALDRQ